MDPGSGKQLTGFEQMSSQIDTHASHQVDQGNLGCPSQGSHGYSMASVHHNDKSYLGQDLSYNTSIAPRMQPRDASNHGVVNVRSAPKGFSTENYSSNVNINTSPSRGRTAPPIHYLRDDNSCAANVMGTNSTPITLTIQHQQGRDDNSVENGIFIGNSGVQKSIQREENNVSTTSVSLTGRSGTNIQLAKDVTGFRPQQNVNDKNNMLTEESDDGNYKLGTKDYTEMNLPQELMSKMFGLLKEGMFCDAVLLAGDKEIRVHKMVLIAASPFLLSKMSKTTPSTSLRVDLPSGIPLQVASQLVHYLYDGKVTLTTDNVSQFARVANLFKLEHLINICEDFVNCFNLDQSLLAVLEEDIRVSATVPEDQPRVLPVTSAVSSPIKQTKDSQREETDLHGQQQSDTIEDLEYAPEDVKRKKGKRKSTVKNVVVKGPFEKDSPNKPMEQSVIPTSDVIAMTTPDTETVTKVTHKISHFYGTRAASAASKEKKESTDSSSEKVLSEEKSILVQSTSPIKPKRGVKKGKKGKKELSKAVMVKKGKMIMVHKKDLPEKNYTNGDSNIDNENLENNPSDRQVEIDDDGGEDWEMVMNFGRIPSSHTVGTSDQKKTGRQKKSPMVNPPKKEMPLRPPPKKRAREFAENEENELETSGRVEGSIDVPGTQSFEKSAEKKVVAKNKKKRKKGWGKGQMTISKSCLAAIVTELENKAESIPEQDRQFKCNLCGNEFVFAKRSITHVLKTHDISAGDVLNFITIRKFEKSPKVCDICGYETKDPNFYYVHYHKYFRHGVPLPKGWKPFTCDICGKECFTKFQLKDHKLIHVEDTPFICEMCGQGFKSRTCLNSHVFHKHSAERKHECKECEKTFKTRTQLMVHSRIHTGEKPFHCPDCSYKSTTRGNMRLHLTNKHKFDHETIKCMMYQIKTLAKSYELPGDILVMDVESSINENGMLNVNNDNQKTEMNVFKSNQQSSQLQTGGSEQHNYSANTNIKFSNLIVPHGTANHVSYPATENQEQHVILQNYHTQQVITGDNLQQAPASSLVQEVPVSDSHATTTPVLMPAEHLPQSHHYIVQTHQADENTGILTPVGSQSIVHDPRVLGQDTHILVPDNHTLVSNEQIILSEQDQIALNSATRGQGHEHHVLYTERDIADPAQMLIADRNSVTPLQDVADKISELQNVPPQVFIEANHQNVQIHIQTVQLETDEHGQIITHRDRKGQSYTLGDTVHPATVTLVRDDNVTEKGDAGSLTPNLHKQQIQQHLGQMSMGHDIMPDNYHQVSYSSTPTSHTTYVVNSQNNTTSIEAAGQMGVSPPTPSQSHTPQSNNSQTPPPSQSPAGLSAHGYTDAQLYQFYQQQYQSY